jgi:hypothetical protein
MSSLAKQNENGRRAEYRTEAFLVDHFWVLKLAVDLDGAVFLARPATRSVESILQPTNALAAAVIQSKSWEAGLELEVAGQFIEASNRRPQKASFVSIHSENSFGKAEDYFFTAEEVQASFKRKKNSEGQDAFFFAVTDDKNFSQFRRKNRLKASMISAALSEVNLDENQAFLKRVCETLGSTSVQPPLVQLAENQWQMRYREALFELEQDEKYEDEKTSIVRGTRSDTSGQRELTPMVPLNSLDDYEFDPFNEEWVLRSR